MQGKNVLLLVVKHWHGLPREDLDALSLETFRAWLDGTLEQPVLVEDVPASSRELGLDSFELCLSTQAILLWFATEEVN